MRGICSVDQLKVDKTSKCAVFTVRAVKALNTCMTTCTYTANAKCSLYMLFCMCRSAALSNYYLLQSVIVRQHQLSMGHSRQWRQLSLELRIAMQCINLLRSDTSVLGSQRVCRPIRPARPRWLVAGPCRLPFHQVLAHCASQQLTVRQRRRRHPWMPQCLHCS